MIGYTKSETVPSSLARGVAANAANCAAYDADPEAYRSGVAKFEISKGIYGTKVVKRVLKRDQHDKCAFCEAIFDANVAGDVEHYRPKGAVNSGTEIIFPGYYWLGYEWTNLCYACPDCNGSRKRTHFPLSEDAARALDHHDDIEIEEPLLLDPYGPRNPRDHIQFVGEMPVWSTDAGEKTVKILGLDRTGLARDRLDHLRMLTIMFEIVEVLGESDAPKEVQLVTRARALLEAAILPTAKFSSAATDHLIALAAGENHVPEAPAS